MRAPLLLLPATLALAGCGGLGFGVDPAPRAPVTPVQQQQLAPVGQAPPAQTPPPPAAPQAQTPPPPGAAAPPPAQAQTPPPQIAAAGPPPGGVGGIGSRPPGQGAAPAAGPAFIPMTPQAVPGEWTALDRGGTAQCRLTLEGPASGSPPRATPAGCVSQELFRVSAWQSRGQDIMLLDNRGAPLIMLRPTGAGRFEGTGLSRERYAMWR